MATITQAEIDLLKSEVLTMTTGVTFAKLEADLKSRENISLEGQKRFLERVRDALETAEVADYLPASAKSGNNGGPRKPDASNPFSAAGWNKSHQAGIVKRLGAEKAEAMAKAAGVTLGSTRPNPLFN